MASTNSNDQPTPQKGDDDADSHYCGYACGHIMGRDDKDDPIYCGSKCCTMVTPGDNHQAYGTHRCVQHR
jgi:hypothetical protein